MNPKLPPAFDRTLRSDDDWLALIRASERPFHEARAVTPQSRSHAVSPLAQQALLTLSAPNEKRVQALRTAIKLIATPGLQAGEGPQSELGLLMLAAHANLGTNFAALGLSNGIHRSVRNALEAHGIAVDQAWSDAWASLAEWGNARPSPATAHGKSAAHTLTFKDAWRRWNTEAHRDPERTTPSPYQIPSPSPTAQHARIWQAIQQGEAGNSLTEGGWRLAWMVEHGDPRWVVERIASDLPLAMAVLDEDEAKEATSSLFDVPDDATLCEALDVLSQKLGHTVDVAWKDSRWAARLPQCHARHRQLILQTRPAAVAVRPRPRV